MSLESSRSEVEHEYGLSDEHLAKYGLNSAELLSLHTKAVMAKERAYCTSSSSDFPVHHSQVSV